MSRGDEIRCDVAVAGGGLAGLSAAGAFAARGLRVVCVEPGRGAGPAGADLRSTAILEPGIELLAEAGLWARLEPHATDLGVMRLIDAGGPDGAERERVDFTARELGRARFGANLANAVLGPALAEGVAAMPFATLLRGVSVARATPRDAETILMLSDGRRVRARLAVAADGRDSPLRAGAGIGVRRWEYGQHALVFAVAHEVPHGGVSTEVHRTGGPFTLVPLPDRDGVPHSAVVWMERSVEARRLMALGAEAFSAEATGRSCGVLGALTLAGERGIWPIVSQLADRLSAKRLALVAEAAHVMPPIGAQGLNTSLADIAALRDLVADARDAGADIGSERLLAAYATARHREARVRVLGVDALNRAALARALPVRDLRRAGLSVLARTPLKTRAMRLGLG